MSLSQVFILLDIFSFSMFCVAIVIWYINKNRLIEIKRVLVFARNKASKVFWTAGSSVNFQDGPET